MELQIPFVRKSDISVATENDSVADSLKGFFLSYLRQDTTERKADPDKRAFSVNIIVNPSIVCLRDDLPWYRIALYNRSGWAVKRAPYRFLSDKTSFFCKHDSSQDTFFLEAATKESAYVEGRCLIRACIEKLLFEEGFTLFHGAVVVSPQRKGTLIVGDKGSGKTTITMQLIDRSFKYLENDRVFLKLVDNRLIALPRPAFVRIGAETCRRVKFLQRFVDADSVDHQDKIIFDRFLVTTGIPFEVLGTVEVVILANIFSKYGSCDKRDLLSRSLLDDIPGLAAFRGYFPECHYKPSAEAVVGHLEKLPCYAQVGTDIRSLAKIV